MKDKDLQDISVNISKKEYKPLVVKWSSEELLRGITSKDVTATNELRAQVKRELWGDMCAENDAENLWHHLYSLNIEFTPEFVLALNEWRTDERNHYVGLRQICSTMYNISEEEIDEEMGKRIGDFSNLNNFLLDEFTICIILAYDELVSARGYNMFFDDFKNFGPSQYAQWVKYAARDEALHFQNFLNVVIINHSERLNEAEGILSKINVYEKIEPYKYNATFLLDHTPETFTREFLLDCGQTLLNTLDHKKHLEHI